MLEEAWNKVRKIARGRHSSAQCEYPLTFPSPTNLVSFFIPPLLLYSRIYSLLFFICCYLPSLSTSLQLKIYPSLPVSINCLLALSPLHPHLFILSITPFFSQSRIFKLLHLLYQSIRSWLVYTGLRALCCAAFCAEIKS